jgi:hypothetical protein
VFLLLCACAWVEVRVCERLGVCCSVYMYNIGMCVCVCECVDVCVCCSVYVYNIGMCVSVCVCVLKCLYVQPMQGMCSAWSLCRKPV